MESEVCTTMRDLECDLSKKIMMFEMLFRKGQEDRGVYRGAWHSQTEQTRIASEERMAGLRAFGHFNWHQISPYHFKMLCASK